MGLVNSSRLNGDTTKQSISVFCISCNDIHCPRQMMFPTFLKSVRRIQGSYTSYPRSVTNADNSWMYCTLLDQ